MRDHPNHLFIVKMIAVFNIKDACESVFQRAYLTNEVLCRWDGVPQGRLPDAGGVPGRGPRSGAHPAG